nr:hypothetical protein CFP56_56397 [Quercus suber]
MVKSISTLIQLSLSLFLSLSLKLTPSPETKGKKSRKEASLARFSGTKSFRFQLFCARRRRIWYALECLTNSKCL